MIIPLQADIAAEQKIDTSDASDASDASDTSDASLAGGYSCGANIKISRYQDVMQNRCYCKAMLHA